VRRTADRRRLERTRLACEIALAYARARRELRAAPIEQAIEQLRRSTLTPAAAPSHESVVQAHRLGRAVVRSLALLPGDTRCLTRSLVLSRLLARRGIAARLVIAARPGPPFQAHAWVECGGAAVLEPGDESFARLTEL
jgi:hypothetical protein